MTKLNQFDMEQQIMTCWNVCEDLDTLSEGVVERNMTTDNIANVLIGMKDLYQLKFEKLMEQFEDLVKELYQLRKGREPGYIYMSNDNMNSVGDNLADSEWSYTTTIKP